MMNEIDSLVDKTIDKLLGQLRPAAVLAVGLGFGGLAGMGIGYSAGHSAAPLNQLERVKYPVVVEYENADAKSYLVEFVKSPIQKSNLPGWGNGPKINLELMDHNGDQVVTLEEQIKYMAK